MRLIFKALADLVVVIHLCYVGFVILGFLAILIGAWRGWTWIRNWWIRTLHLVAIALVAAQSLLRIPCPLTVWEHNLRVLAGEEPAPGSFFPRLIHGILFKQWDPWVFTSLYVAFTLLVLVTLFLIPPRWSARSAEEA